MVCDPQQRPLIPGWQEPTGAKLWCISLHLSYTNLPTLPTDATTEYLQAFSAYDLPIVEALVQYFHAAARFLVQDTWICSIKYGNCYSWPGLIYANAAKYFPPSDKPIMGHLLQSIQGVR